MRTGTLAAGALLVVTSTACGQVSRSDSIRGVAAVSSTAPSSAAPSSSVDLAADEHGQVHSKAAAAAALSTLQARVQLPPGAVRKSAPFPQHQGVTGVSDGSATNVAAVSWYTVPGKQDDLATFVKGHPPRGYVMSSDGSGASDEQLFEFVPAPGTTAPHGLLNEDVVKVGTATALLVHAQVDWEPARSALETIPATVTTATAHWDAPDLDPSARPVHLDRTLTGSSLAGLVGALNASDVADVGGVRSCPKPSGEAFTLTLAYGGHHEVFSDNFSGCSGVGVTVDGVEQAQLSRPDWLAQVHHAMGVTAAMGPEVKDDK